MCRLSALLPVAKGVAGYAALCREAATRRAAGDSRSRGQLMADVLIERLTGQSAAAGVPIEVSLLMPADSLLSPAPAVDDDRQSATRDADEPTSPGGDEPAHLDGYGPVPAAVARGWLLDPARTAPTWIRRLYTHPRTGDLVAMDSRRRLFTAGQRRFLRLRDQVCRTPWCEAPIRHFDHVVPAAEGGPTSTSNGQGTCEGCNHAKQAPGWRARPGPGGVIKLTTPTGHEYQSRPPELPRGTGPPPPARPASWRVIVDYVHFAA
jgi:5-methylcytosine-specific restriction endonuclease McrA